MMILIYGTIGVFFAFCLILGCFSDKVQDKITDFIAKAIFYGIIGLVIAFFATLFFSALAALPTWVIVVGAFMMCNGSKQAC